MKDLQSIKVTLRVKRQSTKWGKYLKTRYLLEYQHVEYFKNYILKVFFLNVLLENEKTVRIDESHFSKDDANKANKPRERCWAPLASRKGKRSRSYCYSVRGRQEHSWTAGSLQELTVCSVTTLQDKIYDIKVIQRESSKGKLCIKRFLV